MEEDKVWQITMRGRLGYGCETGVAAENARNSEEAMSIARMMFPELTVVSAELLDAEVTIAKLSTPS